MIKFDRIQSVFDGAEKRFCVKIEKTVPVRAGKGV